MLGSQTNDLFGVGGTNLLMVEVTPGFKAGVTATVVGLGVGGGVVAVSEKKTNKYEINFLYFIAINKIKVLLNVTKNFWNLLGYVTGHPMTSTLSAIFPCQVCGRIRKYWA